jgi:S1-C subfamily serine protease
VAAVGIGAAVAPTLSAQATAARRAPKARALEMLVGGTRIGISVHDVEDEDVKAGKLSAPAGAVVDDVTEGGPADKAGMKTGDIVVEFDGERVRSARQLTRVVQETPEGRKVQAVEPRSGDGYFSARLRDLEDLGREFSDMVPTPPPPPAAPRPYGWRFDDLVGRGDSRLGISVDRLSGQLAEYFGTKEGILVTSVYDDSPAAKAGLKAGDVITSYNGSQVDDPAELRRRIRDTDDAGEFTIGVMRDRKPLTLKGKMERRERRRTYRSMV